MSVSAPAAPSLPAVRPPIVRQATERTPAIYDKHANLRAGLAKRGRTPDEIEYALSRAFPLKKSMTPNELLDALDILCNVCRQSAEQDAREKVPVYFDADGYAVAVVDLNALPVIDMRGHRTQIEIEQAIERRNESVLSAATAARARAICARYAASAMA